MEKVSLLTKNKFKNLKNHLTIIIVSLCICISSIMLYSTLHNLEAKKVVNSTVIAERLSKIAELSTMKYNYSNVVALKSDKKFSGISLPFTRKSFLIKYNGYIKAGVDLKNPEILVQDKEVTLLLPKAKIFDHAIDEQNLMVYDEQSALFNKLTLEDMLEEISNEKNKIEKEVIASGFLDEATKNTRTLLQNILSDMGFEKVVISFQ